jgi:uncharacterized membrane protein
MTTKSVLRWLLTIIMIGQGTNHFISVDAHLAMMPAELPYPLALVYISGVAEIAGGLGLILPATRRYAAWGLILLLLAVFPANVNMAVNHIPLAGRDLPAWALWARLPFQLVFLAWTYWYTRPDR